MCRLLGIAASEPTDFQIVLRESPRSLAALSREHPDGWGIAIFDDAAGWRVDKSVVCAGEDERFHRLAVGARGEMLISHVRRKTVGDTSLVNTHPFESGNWVFAHNGTVKETAWVRSQTAPERLDEVGGETDSELLFAWLLTKLDEVGVTSAPASPETDRAVGLAVRAARARSDFGAFTFLLSNGVTTYAYRCGRSLYLLERTPEDPVRVRRTSSDGTSVMTPWSRHRTAVIVASEHMTREPWQEIEEGMLLRVERAPVPHFRLVAA
jgi:glutamine amidotransferase